MAKILHRTGGVLYILFSCIEHLYHHWKYCVYLERGRDLLEVGRRVLSAAEIREAPDGVPGHGHAAGLGEHGQQRRENALD